MNRKLFSLFGPAVISVLLTWCSSGRAADTALHRGTIGKTDFEEILDLSPPVLSGDIPAWVDRLTVKANKGDTEAQEVLGRHFEENSEHEAAIGWFEKAAAKG